MLPGRIVSAKSYHKTSTRQQQELTASKITTAPKNTWLLIVDSKLLAKALRVDGLNCVLEQAAKPARGNSHYANAAVCGRVGDRAIKPNKPGR